ncbi:dihydrofolate reductase family protein [Actinacidiphila rubida]|uniref:Dihydrofolate reductase n=1 Tax=Actinacidiphila rubida TaxID=310780 RepID=A0A1H8K719_9ACTN|nr:dihydrofolate reductase family protein [Actinacidiphila rubida]SEN88507.1 Dihydrofolate reductase [Actinacidiphila rubida]
MGKIIISSNATLDGVVQDPDGEEGFERGGWFHQFVEGEDLAAWAARETEEVLGAEALLLGGRTSEWFASRMLTGDDADVRVSRAWADRVKSIPKYVVSSTLDDPRWSHATLVNGDVVKEISELKENVDGDILVYGSYQLVRMLTEQDLADELRLVVFPVVVGAGLRIFDGTSGSKALRPVDTRRVGDRLVLCTYAFAHGPRLQPGNPA